MELAAMNPNRSGGIFKPLEVTEESSLPGYGCSRLKGIVARLPVNAREAGVVVLLESLLALIYRLFRMRGPAAVFLAVVAIVVNSVKGAVVRLVTHILVEVGKGKPPFADFDSSSAIPCVASGIRVFAALNHGDPQVVDPSFAHAVLDHLQSPFQRVQYRSVSSIHSQ